MAETPRVGPCPWRTGMTDATVAADAVCPQCGGTRQHDLGWTQSDGVYIGVVVYQCVPCGTVESWYLNSATGQVWHEPHAPAWSNYGEGLN